MDTKEYAAQLFEQRETTKQAPPAIGKIRVNSSLERIDRLRRVVLNAQRQDSRLTLKAAIERGVDLVIDELVAKHGEPGSDIPSTVKFRPGRRIGQ